MNFYATPAYLDVVAEVYFKGRRTRIEDVRIGDEVLRLLVVDEKHIITNGQFLDYHEPLQRIEIRTPTRDFGYAESVVRRIIERGEWEPTAFQGFVPAPYVDWSIFPTFDRYTDYIKARSKGMLREQERRRARLIERYGDPVFLMNDEGEDVLELARRWKSQQLRATGVKDYWAEPKHMEYFRLLRQRGLLTSSTLRVSGRLLSVWLGFVHDGVWSGWIFCYDPELRKYSPGHQLLHAMLEESHRRRHREFDFSIGDEDYKWLYATHARLLGPIGRAPIQVRILANAKHLAKMTLSRSPKLLEMARALRKAIKRF